MAHGFGIGKQLIETGNNIQSILYNVSDNGANEFDAYTQIFEEIETFLHDCNLSSFTSKFMAFMLAQWELANETKKDS